MKFWLSFFAVVSLALVQTFTVNALNQLSNATRSGNITVAGFTTTNASVTVNGNAADEYEDLTFARTNLSLAAGNNTFTAVAADGAGRGATNSITVNLPATVSYTYDQNGNLTSDGSRTFAYDDENQLIRVGAADWETHFIYDALMRKRVQLHYQAATNGTTDFVSGATSLSTLIRNDADVWAGTKFTVGSVPLVVTELGRWVISGNSQSHTVRLAYANGADVPGGSISVNTAGAPAGQFKYAALASPVTLSPYTTYYIVSREFNGGDQWYSYDNVLTTTSAATIDTMAYAQVAAPNTFFTGSHPGGCWGPLSFRYETDWDLTSETRYLYDGLLPIQERDGHNIPRVTYTRGLDLSGTLQSAGGIGGLLARTDHSSLTPYHSFYHADGSGNITALLNTQQHLVARYAYDPFGALLAQSGPLAEANTMRFSSKEHHLPSGLSYYGFRFYDPSLQRWLSRDPIAESGGINLYGFVRNRPNNSVDAFGESDFNRPPALIVGGPTGTTAYYGPPRPEPTGRTPGGMNAAAAAGIAASMVPGVGEQMDMNVLNDPNSKGWEKGLAGVSLAANIATRGLAPNAGAFLRRPCPKPFSNANLGNAMHQKFLDALTKATGTKPSDWRMRTRPGQTGVDAAYVGPTTRNPGFNYAELKPDSPYSMGTFGNQLDNWGLPPGETQLWLYDQGGAIYSSGFNF